MLSSLVEDVQEPGVTVKIMPDGRAAAVLIGRTTLDTLMKRRTLPSTGQSGLV